VATIQEALQQDPDDAWTFYAAAVVYVAVGDLTSALVNSRLALARGVEARWFSLGFFEVLKTEPEFQALVARDPIPAQ